MAVTGRLLPMPAFAPAPIQEQERGLSHHRSLSEAPRPRIYRIPRSGDWVAGGVYGPDGRLSANGLTGLRIDLAV